MCLFHSNTDKLSFFNRFTIVCHLGIFLHLPLYFSGIGSGRIVIVLNSYVCLCCSCSNTMNQKGPIDLLLDNYCFAFLSCLLCYVCVFVYPPFIFFFFSNIFIFYVYSSTIIISLYCSPFITL